ncbi:MAG: M24 family metallopeptidase [Candidatus Hodarchaeota archaeon]
MDKISHTRKLMEKENIDILLTMEPHNLYYLSGWMPLVYTRPIIVLVPLENETTLILPKLELKTAQRYAHNIQKYLSYTEEKYGVVEAASRSLIEHFSAISMTKAKVGIEENFLPVRYYRLLKENFPETEFVNATSIIEKLRMIKSESEIELAKKAAKLTEIGLESCLYAEKAGKTELELRAEGTYGIQTKGAILFPDTSIGILGMVLSGYKAADPHEIPSGKKIMEGEVVRHGWLATANGYWASCGRPTCIGEPNDIQREIYETVLEAQRKGLDLVKPGIKVSDIHTKIREIITEAGFGRYPQARTGSGIGLSYHEPPYLRLSDDTKLMQNMIITVQPEMSAPDLSVGLGIGDTVLVTSDGHEILTKFTKDTM